MYFSSNAGGEYHIWRQRYPDGTPEQITFGPTEQEGTAITSDGKHVWIANRRGNSTAIRRAWPMHVISSARSVRRSRGDHSGAVTVPDGWSACDGPGW